MNLFAQFMYPWNSFPVMLSTGEQRFLRTLSKLSYCNPFSPERLQLEQQALGADYQAEDQIAWSRNLAQEEADRPNVVQLTARAETLANDLRERFFAGESLSDEQAALYQDLVYYVLYYRHLAILKVDDSTIGSRQFEKQVASTWQTFEQDYRRFLELPHVTPPVVETIAHLFACLWQLRRAFRFVFDNILGDSLPAANLRAMVWQSVFTHDMRRYRRVLFNRMQDFTTLITGPSGTGKELVARAISLSQYMPLDIDKQKFVGDLEGAFLPVNLSALSPTLIESELFGHAKGAFTGAVSDRQGWLECCPPHGAVFLDEIGELDPMLQVKLLRVVQSRCYSRSGETKERRFEGKLIAATNRNLAAEISAGNFRDDLYYRLCADRIVTPSLAEHLADRPEALEGLVAFIARWLVGEEANSFTGEVLAWIDQHLPSDYTWPGNIRELEQCVRNVLVRQHYQPQQFPPKDAGQKTRDWLREAEQGTLSHGDLLSRYCTWVYAKLGSYQQTAEVLGLDRRTVRSKVDQTLLMQMLGEKNV